MLFISKANGMDFAKRDSNLPNRENTLSYEEKFASLTTEGYCQRWLNSNTVVVQLGSDTATVPTIEVFEPNPSTVEITASLISSYTDDPVEANWRYYFQLSVVFASFTDKRIQIKVTQGEFVYLSEYQKGDLEQSELDNGQYMRFDYGNSAQPSDHTNFMVDYTTGISFFFYVEAIMKNIDPQGEDEVFTSIDTKVLLEAIIFIGLVLQTGRIPRFLIWKLHLAGKHFYFLVNDLQQVSIGNPEVIVNRSNLFQTSWKLTQKDSEGVNTDNIGIESTTNEEIMTRKIEDLTDADSFVILAGYILHVIYVDTAAGSVPASFVMKAGYNVGGSDIIAEFIGTITKTEPPKPFVLHEQKSFDVDVTVYLTMVSGVGAIGRVYANLIKNS